jgi:lipid-A-disaccharide synthase
LIQNEASGENIAREALSILNNTERKKQIIEELAALRSKLGSPGAARRAAQIACNMI